MKLNSLAGYERKVWSQHGEDGIIQALTQSLKTKNRLFLEIGATWTECNSRNLIENGWDGVVYDLRDVSQFPHGIQRKITPRTVPSLHDFNRDYVVPDFFSLDIDSYDYFVADALLRKGFRPKVICVEFNSFIRGPRTVQYVEPFARYQLQPRYGLYFGAGLEAWKHLFKEWRFVGCESTYTNAFFVRDSDWQESDDFGYQTYFCKKYGKSGEELSETLEGMPLLDVTGKEYQAALGAAMALHTPVIEAVTTYTAAGYDLHAKRFLDTWNVPIWCFEEPLLAKRPEPHIRQIDMSETRVAAFKQQYGHHNGRTLRKTGLGLHGDEGGAHKPAYNYVWDAVRWSHRIFALAEGARRSKADLLINIDSDIVVFEPFDSSFVVDLLGDADIAYMPRHGMYSECSFVVYRLSNPLVREFIEEHEKMYTTGLIFQIKEGWTDCHAFDVLLKVYKRHGLIVKDINEGLPQSMHPFVNGPLGRYMDHMKGNRKVEGKSRSNDLVVPRSEAYWKT